MKIKECLTEGAGDNLFGTWTMPNKEIKEPKASKQEVQKGFLNKFYTGIYTALNKAINNGTVNPSLTNFEDNSSNDDDDTVDDDQEQSQVDMPYAESRMYLKLNRLFESIVEAGEGEHQLSIYQYLKDWYASYMRNINWNNDAAQVDQLLRQVQTSYRVDKGKAAILKLGNVTYDIASKARETRRNAQLNRANDYDDYDYDDGKISPVGSSGDQVADSINSQLERLMKINPHAYQQAIKMLDKNITYRNSQL